MTVSKPKKLSDVVDTFASQGSNDARWFLVEHQLAQAKISLQTAGATLGVIIKHPENEEERIAACDCQQFVMDAYIELLAKYTAFLSYIANGPVSDRIGRKEL